MSVRGGEGTGCCISGVEKASASRGDGLVHLASRNPRGTCTDVPIRSISGSSGTKSRASHPPSTSLLRASPGLPSGSDDPFQITGLSSSFPFPRPKTLSAFSLPTKRCSALLSTLELCGARGSHTSTSGMGIFRLKERCEGSRRRVRARHPILAALRRTLVLQHQPTLFSQRLLLRGVRLWVHRGGCSPNPCCSSQSYLLQDVLAVHPIALQGWEAHFQRAH